MRSAPSSEALLQAKRSSSEAMFPELITELLQDGYKVNFCAPGHSMFPTIMANESIIVEPVDPETVRLKDIILYRTNGQLIAHRVVSIDMQSVNSLSSNPDLDPQSSPLSPHHCFILRGDASATCDKPVTPAQILGKVISIERYGHHVNPYSFKHRVHCYGLTWLTRFQRLLRLMFSIFSGKDR